MPACDTGRLTAVGSCASLSCLRAYSCASNTCTSKSVLISVPPNNRGVWGVSAWLAYTYTCRSNFSPAAGNHDDTPPDTQGDRNGTYTGLDEPGELMTLHCLLAAFKAIVELAQGKNKVLAITSGHDHGNSYCAKSPATQGLNLWYVIRFRWSRKSCADSKLSRSYWIVGQEKYNARPRRINDSGGYVTDHSEVRNGRVLSLKLSDIQRPFPSVVVWDSCEFFDRILRAEH